jgi:hypothetical protein
MKPRWATACMGPQGWPSGWPPVGVAGTFQRCNEKSVPKDFVTGKTYTTCFAYLMPGGGSIQQVTWPDKPVVWSGH